MVGETDGCVIVTKWNLFPDTFEAVPVWSSEQFATALKEAGAKVILDVRKGMTCLGVLALPEWVSSKQHMV